uniref:Domain of unknown function DB domain-containing protein n=1 Tax=Romanomermis culicivorax TaxID=13658 RepID=A0A915JT36_ROMCU
MEYGRRSASSKFKKPLLCNGSRTLDGSFSTTDCTAPRRPFATAAVPVTKIQVWARDLDKQHQFWRSRVEESRRFSDLVCILHYRDKMMIKSVIFLTFIALSTACDDACKKKRMDDCCKKHVTKTECLPLCRYDTTTQEMIDAGLKCADQLEVWMYCAADGNKDNTACCKGKNLKSSCDVFCRTGAPKICSRSDIKPFVPCAVKVQGILQCHKDSVRDSQGWSPAKTFPIHKC